MKELFAGLTVCLLISLLLMAVVDGAERECPHLSASLSLTVSQLWDGKWAFAPTWSDRGSRFCIHAGKAGWEFTFDKWRWRNAHHQLQVRLDSSGKFLAKAPMLTSVSIGFQGPVSSREQCAHLGSFVPRTS